MGAPYDDGRHGYGGGQSGAYRDDHMDAYPSGGGGYGGQHQDPFADRAGQQPRMSYDYGAYSQPNHSTAQVQDPYSAIQYQLNNQRSPEGPPQLPPLYR